MINGATAFITNSGTPIAWVSTVRARTDDETSTFVIGSNASGLIVDPPSRKL